LDTGDYTVTKQILRITKHPKYRNALAYYDIAVVEIESLELTDHIGPGLSLPISSYIEQFSLIYEYASWYSSLSKLSI
jgi:hypothetical protein